MGQSEGGVSKTMSAMKNTQDMNSGEPGNIFKIDVTKWSVSYNADDGNLVAQCELQPESGVTIISASISLSLASAPNKPLFFGGAGNNGTGGQWFAVCGSPYKAAPGTSVISTITGLASSSAYGYAFQKTFTI